MLTIAQQSVLEALADRLIPPDSAPGAVEAGAVLYLLRQFQGDLASFIPIYATGLDALDAEAHSLAGQPFSMLPADAQDELVRRAAQGDTATPWPIDSATFIQIAAEHVAEGFYSDPGNGGNHNMASWKMIGFEVRG